MILKKKLKFNLIRKKNYRDRIKSAQKFSPPIDIRNWSSNPYTFLKSIYYIESSSLVVYLSQFTKVTPNELTSIYIIMGLLGGLLLSIDNEILNLTALIFFFTRGTFDWSDGVLARILNKTSSVGNLLDNWGAKIGSLSFYLGFGLDLQNKYSGELFYYLIIILMFLKSTDLRDYAYHLATFELMKKKNKNRYLNLLNFKRDEILKMKKGFNFYLFFKNIFINFVDERSRTIDIILLLIFLDIFYFDIFFIKYIFFYILFKSIVIFFAGIYSTVFKNYIFKGK